ncbi:MAG: chitobiase/beta-hexosaminidase C-terminal domain-containing protein, partial [Aeromonadaceae bacterium]
MNKWLLTAGLIGTASQAIAAVDTVAPTVSRSPAPGTYSVAQSVKLAIKDNADAKPNLYYTTDGSLPGVHSKLYRGEVITVTDTNPNDADYDLKIRTLAMDINGNMARNNFFYRIKNDDKVAPKVYANPVAGTYTSAQKIALKVTDDKDKAPKIYYTLDGKTPTTKSVLYVPGQVLNAVDKVAGSEFDLRIRTLAVDAAGNQAFRNFGYVINSTTADTTAPEVAVSPLPGKFSSKQTVTLQVSDTQDKAPKLYYTLDGSAASASSTLYTGPISVEKSTVINTYAVDASGNKVTGKYSYEIGSETGVGDGYLLDQYVSPGIAIYVKSGWTKTNLHSFS